MLVTKRINGTKLNGTADASIGRCGINQDAIRLAAQLCELATRVPGDLASSCAPVHLNRRQRNWELDRARHFAERLQFVISLKELLHKASTINRKAWIWIGLGITALWSLRIYYVQEMLAAFIAFSLLFLVVSAVVFAVFFLVRIVKPILKPAIAWVTPKVRWAARQSVNAVEGVLPKPVWAQAVPHGFQRERLKLNEKYKTVYLRFASLRPNHVYRIGLRAGGAALTAGLSTQKRISNRLGDWLTEKVTYSDLVHLVSLSQVRNFARFQAQTFARRNRRASGNSRNQMKRRSSPAVLTHSSAAGTGCTATDAPAAARAKAASAGNP